MPSNQRNSRFPFSDNDCSEIKKGNLVFIQGTSILPSSTTTSKTNEQTLVDVEPQSKTIKRLPVVVKVYCKSCKHFAIVNFVGRRQMCLPPMYVSLKKYNVHHPMESNTVVLAPIDMDGFALTFEATTPAKASEWAKAFDRQNRNVFGDGSLKNSLKNLLEIISEEMCPPDKTMSSTFDNNEGITQCSRDSTFHRKNPKYSSITNMSSKSRSTHFPKSLRSSRHQTLPVLSEQEDESNMESDNDCLTDLRVD